MIIFTLFLINLKFISTTLTLQLNNYAVHVIIIYTFSQDQKSSDLGEIYFGYTSFRNKSIVLSVFIANI